MTPHEVETAEEVGVAVATAGIIGIAPLIFKRIVQWWKSPSLSQTVTNLNSTLLAMQSTMELQYAALTTGLAEARSAQLITESHMMLVLDEHRTAMWITDADGRCVYVNRALCDMFGMTREEMLSDNGTGWLRAIVETQRSSVWEQFQKTLHMGIPWDCTYGVVRDGKIVTTHAKGVVIRDHDGRVMRVRGTCEPAIWINPDFEKKSA